MRRRTRKLKTKRPYVKYIMIGLLVLATLIVSVYLVNNWFEERYQKYIKVYNEFVPALAPGDTSQAHVKLDTSTSLNLLFLGLDLGESGHIKTDVIYVGHYDSRSQTFSVYPISTNVKFFVTQKSTYIDLKNIYAIGQLETPAKGLDMTVNALQNELAIQFDGYIAVEKNLLGPAFELLGNFTVYNPSVFKDNDIENGQNSFDEGNISLGDQALLNFVSSDEGGVYTQAQRHYGFVESALEVITKDDFYKLVGDIGKLDQYVFSNIEADTLREMVDQYLLSDDVTFDYYNPPDIYSETKHIDELIPTVNQANFDSFLFSILESSDLIREQARIEVYNSTDAGGLASKYSRWIRNSGGDVIRSANFEEEYEQSVIFVEDQETYQATISRLSGILPTAVIKNDIPPGLTSTGDIVIILGNDSVFGQ